MIVKNNPNASGWGFDDGYANQFVDGNYPFQMSFLKGRIRNKIIAMLALNKNDFEYRCIGYDKGFKLILSLPGETVETSQNYFRLSTFNRKHFEIRTRVTATSEGLRGYTPNQRKCYYSSDHPLRFFKIYTKKNCEAECKANFTSIECGCVKFSMPSKISSSILFL